MSKYKSLVVLFCLFALAVSANAQSNTATFQWTRDAASDSWWTTLGTVSTSPGIAKAVNDSATVTEILPIPADATLAAITIRSGTASPVIAHASAVAGAITQASFALFMFQTRDDAQFYVDNYTTLTTIPPLYEAYNSSGTYSFVQSNAANANLANWGSYLVSTGRQGFMVFKVYPKAASYDTINTSGVTIRVRFLRQ
ncbi:MAG TPA: hypothetical protein P5527_12925 [Kiritimatiellia bacterium]|nr:hypothetical protein [Kiritimatiellia bacterium]